MESAEQAVIDRSPRGQVSEHHMPGGWLALIARGPDGAVLGTSYHHKNDDPRIAQHRLAILESIVSEYQP